MRVVLAELQQTPATQIMLSAPFWTNEGVFRGVAIVAVPGDWRGWPACTRSAASSRAAVPDQWGMGWPPIVEDQAFRTGVEVVSPRSPRIRRG